MGEDGALARAAELERTEYADGAHRVTGEIVEVHAVGVERWLVVLAEHAFGSPCCEHDGRLVVTVRSVRFVGQIDPHDVVRIDRHEAGPSVGADDVIRGRDDLLDVNQVVGVADRAERLEAGHGQVLADRDA